MARATSLFATYKRLYPKSTDAEILYMAATDRGYFLDSTILAGLRADAGGGKTYMYNFHRETPVLGGRYFAPHAEEIPFVFDSLAKAALIAGPVTPQAQALADKVSALWANFARNGVPSAPGVPAWTPYDSAKRPTHDHRRQEPHGGRPARRAAQADAVLRVATGSERPDTGLTSLGLRSSQSIANEMSLSSLTRV